MAAAWCASIAIRLALKGAGQSVAVSTSDLAQALSDHWTTDPSGRIAKVEGRLHDRVVKFCSDPSLSLGSLFPGSCSAAATPSGMASCLTDAIRCEACRALEETAGLTLDCDAFDDGQSDASCP